jgi:hypothetical protein
MFCGVHMQVSIDLVMTVIRTLMIVAALGAMGWGFMHWRISQRRDTQRLFEQLDLMRGELIVMSDQVVALQSRPAVEVRHHPAPAPEPRQIMASPPPAARGYEVAARLARSGASCEELMSSCGLSRHESELLLRLHSRAPATTTTTAAARAPSVAKPNVANSSAAKATVNSSAAKPSITKPEARPAPVAARTVTEPPRVRSRLSMVG